MYSEDFIAKVKAAADLVRIVGETVQLRRTGKLLVGLSPFNKEKTPSFTVNPETQTFKCFSSDQGGDVFTFLKLTRGLSFPEAVAAAVASMAGIALEAAAKTPEEMERDRHLAETRKRLLKLNRFAARFYQERLEGPGGGAGRDYASKRGIAKESALAFALGFAPDSWTALRDYFLQIKAPMVEAYEVGLFRTKAGEKPKADGSNLFDTFRNRLVFPIRDPQGEVLGFGGRWLGPSNAETPKYLNSPESSVYEKDRILYNLDQAKRSIREQECVVLVEGYMDCLALVQAGFPNVVANCGTALTRTQVGILRKLAPRVICLYDSDKAGQAAMEKAMNLFLDAEGIPLLGARLPEGKDPDEFLSARGEAGRIEMAEILQNSPAILDRWIEELVNGGPKSLQGRTDSLQKIAAKLSKLNDDLAIQARLGSLAKALNFEQELVVAAVQKHKKNFMGGAQPQARARAFPDARSLPQKNPAHIQKNRQIQEGNGKREFAFQRRFLSDLLRHPQWMDSLRKMQEENPLLVLPFVEEGDLREVLERILLPLREGESNQARVLGLLEAYREREALRNLIAEGTIPQAGDLPAKDLNGVLRRLKDEALKRKTAELQKRIATAEKSGDAGASEALLQELMEVRRQRTQI